jgi:Arc/MetJ-type ribon-helix-helix transcriptional regulator
MEPAARRKLHVAPLLRQERAIRKLLREGRYRNATHFVRQAIDYYLDGIGRPTLATQARQMAEDFRRDRAGRDSAIEEAQDASRETDETW